jgi:hypothetical protein
MCKVSPEVAELATAAADDEHERAADPIGKRAELRDMPVNSFPTAAAGRELEGENFDLGAFGDEVAPANEVVHGATVDV